jgi:malic enzyme
VTSGTLIAAAAAAGTPIRDQRVVFLGGGSAGCGIAEKIIALMVDDGLSETEARRRIFMVDRFGLLTDEMPNLLDFQRELVTPSQYRPLGYRGGPAVADGCRTQRPPYRADRRVRPAGAV